MAEVGEQFSNVFDSIFGGAFTVVIWIFVGFLLVALGAGLVYYFFGYRKKFDIMVKVISKRAEDNKVYFDKGAILKDKKNNTTYLKLWNTKVQLELPKFNIFYSTNKGDYVEVLRESEKGFRFLTPPEIDETYLYRYDGKMYPIADLKQYQIENDITWILEREKVNKKILNPESIFMKILEYTPQIISMAFSFIILWIVFRYAPDLLDSMRQIMAEARTPIIEPIEVIGG